MEHGEVKPPIPAINPGPPSGAFCLCGVRSFYHCAFWAVRPRTYQSQQKQWLGSNSWPLDMPSFLSPAPLICGHCLPLTPLSGLQKPSAGRGEASTSGCSVKSLQLSSCHLPKGWRRPGSQGVCAQSNRMKRRELGPTKGKALK